MVPRSNVSKISPPSNWGRQWWDTNFKQGIHPPRWFYSRREKPTLLTRIDQPVTQPLPSPSPPYTHVCSWPISSWRREPAQRVPWYKGKTQQRKQSVNRLTSSRLNGHLSTKTALAGSQPPPHHGRPDVSLRIDAGR